MAFLSNPLLTRTSPLALLLLLDAGREERAQAIELIVAQPAHRYRPFQLALLGQYGTFKAADAIENSTPAIKNWGNYWLAGVSMPFQVSKDQKLSIGWAYTKGSDNYLKQGNRPKVVNTAALGRGVVTISYAFTF